METEIYKNLSLENLPNEEWRDVVGYEGSYMVSNLGRVKSLDRYIVTKRGKKKLKGTIIRQHLCHGYCLVGLGRAKNSQKVHQLVAIAFILNPQKLPIINHKNEIKSDNRVENIEWCDYSYNLNYGSRKGWQRRVNGVFDSMAKASKELNVWDSTISECCKGKIKQTKGYIFKYKQ